MSECIFCNKLVRQHKILENELAFVIFDKYPKEKGHALIIPKRHVENLFDMTPEEWAATHDLLLKTKARLDKDHKPDGYNVVSNIGRAAGQEIFHAHVHLIPRYAAAEDYTTRHLL